METQHSSLVFYYWRFGAGNGDGDLSRHTIVNELVVPIFNDAAVRAVAACVRTLEATPGLRAFTHAAMHDHLLRGSRTYAELGEDKWDRFWHEFHRWGPAPNLYPPGHLLENLLLVD